MKNIQADLARIAHDRISMERFCCLGQVAIDDNAMIEANSVVTWDILAGMVAIVVSTLLLRRAVA